MTAAAAFILTIIMLTASCAASPLPILLADRFVPGSGWIEIIALGAYAAVLSRYMERSRTTAVIRLRLWLFFSIVFFAQFMLGIAGFTTFLMTGALHLPIPAMIVAGPIFRGEGIFMPILFASTVLIAGPTWCSYLCYFGAWDGLAASTRRVPAPLPPPRRAIQIAMLLATASSAYLLRIAGASTSTAVLAALCYAVIGLAVMIVWSRRAGAMTHCLTWCPIGVAATWLGRVNPFRIRIMDRCTDCSACRSSCRYDALNLDDIARRRPASSCTLCGDCITSCPSSQIVYSACGLSPSRAKSAFLAIVISFHAVFLGIARI